LCYYFVTQLLLKNMFGSTKNKPFHSGKKEAHATAQENHENQATRYIIFCFHHQYRFIGLRVRAICAKSHAGANTAASPYPDADGYRYSDTHANADARPNDRGHGEG